MLQMFVWWGHQLAALPPPPHPLQHTNVCKKSVTLRSYIFVHLLTAGGTRQLFSGFCLESGAREKCPNEREENIQISDLASLLTTGSFFQG